MKRYLLLFAIVANTAFGDEVIIGLHGIQSKVTGLDGHLDNLFAVNIGSVENYRSGKAGYDSADFSAPNTVPYGVYYNNGGSAAQMEWVPDISTFVGLFSSLPPAGINLPYRTLPRPFPCCFAVLSPFGGEQLNADLRRWCTQT